MSWFHLQLTEVSLIFLSLSIQTVKNHLSFYFKPSLMGKIFKRETGMIIMVPSMRE